jgi:DNA polymerase I-like protein with 3'-5' exonuclease and polymerase domains
MEHKAKITCIGLARADGQCKLVTGGYGELLRQQQGRPTSGWNLLFDVAWLIADGHYEAVNRVPWFDAMLLWKWYENGVLKERIPRWSLVDGAKRWLKDWPGLAAFVDMKAAEPAPGTQDKYWETRGKMDAYATAMIAKKIWDNLSEKKRRGASIEMRCLVPVARSWVMGVPMNLEKIKDAAPHIADEMKELEQKLQVSGKVISSPKQLGDLLFKHWGLEPIAGMVTPTGTASTDKKHLTYLAESDDRVLQLLRYRELSVRMSKFMVSPQKAADYLGSHVVHPSPALFSTYTGRMTYKSKTKSKYQTGVALHQWQRNKEVRSLIGAPPGYRLAEFDASGQEDRLMALISEDTMLLKIFTDDMDIHCYTAASITGQGYDALMGMKRSGDDWLMGPKGMRQAGKVTNHSNKYRIGKAAMRITAKVQYGLDITLEESARWQRGFKRSFPRVPLYWDAAAKGAKRLGYAETLAGRTFLTPESFFQGKDKWPTESSSINFPIQGSGADMKELAIATMHEKFPEALFAIDMHDGLFFYVPIGTPMEMLYEMQRELDNLDYTREWGYTPSIPLTWDGEFGDDWGNMTKLDKTTQEFL